MSKKKGKEEKRKKKKKEKKSTLNLDIPACRNYLKTRASAASEKKFTFF